MIPLQYRGYVQVQNEFVNELESYLAGEGNDICFGVFYFSFCIVLVKMSSFR